MAFKFTIDEGQVVQFGGSLIDPDLFKNIKDSGDYAERIILPLLTKFTGTSSFGIVWNTAGVYKHKEYPNSACHANLRYAEEGASLIVSCVRGHTTPHGAAFFNWLLNRSPWADVFQGDKINRKVIAHLRVKTDQPANLIASALIASRGPWEFASSVEHWYDLVSGGMDENLAYITCTATHREKTGKCTPHATENSHWPLSTSMTSKAARNFLKGHYLKTRLTAGTYSKNPDYKGGDKSVYSLFGKVNDYDSVAVSLVDIFSKLSNKKTVVVSGWDGRKVSTPALGTVRETIKLVEEEFNA